MEIMKSYLRSRSFLDLPEHDRLNIIHELLNSKNLESLCIAQDDIYRIYFEHLMQYSQECQLRSVPLNKIHDIRVGLTNLKTRVMNLIQEYNAVCKQLEMYRQSEPTTVADTNTANRDITNSNTIDRDNTNKDPTNGDAVNGVIDLGSEHPNSAEQRHKPQVSDLDGRPRSYSRPKLEKTEKQIFEKVDGNDEKAVMFTLDNPELAKTPETTSGTSYSFSEIFDLSPSLFEVYYGVN